MNKPKNVFIKLCACSVMLASIFITSCFIPTAEQKLEEENSRVIQLQENAWDEGRFSKSGQFKKYTFDVKKGYRYFVYLNDSDDGDRTKDANVGMTIAHSDSTIFSSSYDSASVCYTKPLTFVAPNNGVVTIIAAAYLSGYGNGWGTGTGSYAIKYTSRPEYDMLKEDEWTHDSIISRGQINKYVISAEDKTRIFIYIEDIDAGNAYTTKTANIGLQIILSNGTIICNSYDSASNCFISPYSFLTTSNNAIKIMAAAYLSGYGNGWETGTGSYAIKYSTRPEFDSLTAGEWRDDTIVTRGQINKYNINVTKGNIYKIYLDDIDAGTVVTQKSANIAFQVFYTKDSNVDNPIICNDYNETNCCYANPYSFTAPSDGTITIATEAYLSGYGNGWGTGTGTYAIKYTVTEPDNM